MMKYSYLQLRKSPLFTTEDFPKYQVLYSFKAASLFEVKNTLKTTTTKQNQNKTNQTKQKSHQTKLKPEREMAIQNTVSFKTATIPTEIIEQLTRIFFAQYDQSTVKTNTFKFCSYSEKKCLFQITWFEWLNHKSISTCLQCLELDLCVHLKKF